MQRSTWPRLQGRSAMNRVRPAARAIAACSLIVGTGIGSLIQGMRRTLQGWDVDKGVVTKTADHEIVTSAPATILS